MRRLILSAVLGALLAAPALGQDLALKVEHEITTLSADGVTRVTRFGERLIRRDRQSWMARIVPPGVHEAAEHQAAARDHKHMDLSAAARWVVLADDGGLRVRVVDTHEKQVIDIARVDYANIGFDGKWATASQLLDPEQLRQLKPAGRSAPAGTRWYEGGAGGSKLAVLWDEVAGYPRRIESGNASGTRRSISVAAREPMPERMPWAGLDGYIQKEYSDLLD